MGSNATAAGFQGLHLQCYESRWGDSWWTANCAGNRTILVSTVSHGKDILFLLDFGYCTDNFISSVCPPPQKHNITFNSDKTRASYTNQQDFVFDRRKSAPLTENDPLVILNMHMNVSPTLTYYKYEVQAEFIKVADYLIPWSSSRDWLIFFDRLI